MTSEGLTSSEGLPVAEAAPLSSTRQRRRLGSTEFWDMVFWRCVIVAVLLGSWQYLPQWHVASEHIRWMDPFFVSSPSRVYTELRQLMTGSNGVPYIWPYLWRTLEGTLIGTSAGLVIGALFGALLSNNDRLSRIFSIFVTVFNSMPRIVLIPIVVVITGPNLEASVIAVILVVAFLAFFNAFEGGRSVPKPVLQNAFVLKAKPWQIMLRVRFPYVLMWTFAVVPNAISFGLLTAVTSELLTGPNGMGGLMEIAVVNANSTLSFAIVVTLSFVGVVLVLIADRIKRAVLHWAQ
jgi:NitT/TauT family transport system permease protein